MTTYEQRELVGESPIAKQPLPTESKHYLDIKREEARALAIDNKKMRLLEGYPIVDAKEHTQMELKETLNDRDTKIIESLRNCKNISAEEALHVPYAHYKLAA